MMRPADYLIGITSIEGIPVVSSLDKQLRTPLPHLMIYDDGRVLLVLRSTYAVAWNPAIPLRKQLQPQ